MNGKDSKLVELRKETVVEVKPKSELKAIKIDNAMWLPAIAKQIDAFTERVKIPGVNGATMYAHYAQTIQFGGDFREFWVIFEDGKPVAYTNMYVIGLPHVAKVYVENIYCWTKNKRAVDLLVDEIIKFGKKHKAVFWSADFVGRGNLRLFSYKMKKRGYEGKESNIINTVYRKV